MRNILIYLTLLVTALPAILPAQVSNDNINYQVQFRQAYWSRNDDDGQEEPTILVKAAVDHNNAADYLMTFQWDVASGQTVCESWQAHSPSWSPVRSSNLLLESNTNRKAFDLEFQSFENDCGTSCIANSCANSDDSWWRTRTLVRPTNDVPGTWHDKERSLTDNGSKIKYRYAWRYAAGSWGGDPLRFDELAHNRTKTHLNSNRGTPSGANGSLGYGNLWNASSYGFQSSNDVTYTFVISGKAKEVTISTEYTETNFDTYIHLLGSPTPSSFYPIAKNDDFNGTRKSRIVRQLCAGTYKVIVEGFSNHTGTFKLSVHARDINVTPGSINQPATAQCEGATLPAIVNAASASGNGSISYTWEKKVGSGGWISIPGATGASLSNPGEMGAQSIRFRRKATDCGSSSYSNQVVFNKRASSAAGGTIRISGTQFIPPGADPGSIASTTNGTASPSPVTTYWESKTGNGNWRRINGANGNTYNIPALTQTTSYRRVTQSSCGSVAHSNEITVQVIQPNGIIRGTVKSNLGSGVSQVQVCAERITQVPGASTGQQYCTTTENDGSYEIADIYFGNANATFRLTPSRPNHEFSPAATTRVLRTSAPVYNSVDFTDITVFTVEGQVVQQLGSRTCGIEGVDIKVYRGNQDVSTGVKTDPDGNYQLSINDQGSYRIEPQLGDHFIAPDSRTFFIDDHKSGVNFTDRQKHRVSGYVLAACNEYPGRATLSVFDDENCFVQTVYTNEGTGYFEADLPARNYTIQVTDLIPEGDLEKNAVINFLSAQEIDLSYQDQRIDFTYHRPPVIRVTGLPEAQCSATILEQGGNYPLTIEVWEVPGVCPVDTGTITITDQISDLGDEPITLKISQGRATYTMTPGLPNIISPFQKNIQIVAQDTFTPTRSDDYALNAIVTGARPREQTFATVSPELPMLILRDPPGDASYSYLERNTTTTTATRFYNAETGSTNTWAKARIGTEFEAGVLGFSTETKLWGDLGGSVAVSASSNTTNEIALSISNGERFATSENEDISGQDGDVYMGAALNLLYAVADEIAFNAATCQVESSKSLIVGNDGFSTTYLYTETHIRNTLMPQIRFLRDNSTDPDSVAYFNNQLSVWEQTLQRNQDLKDDATWVQNRSFSANAPFESFTTATTSKTLTVEFMQEIDTEVATELGFEISGSGISGGVTTNMKMEFGESETKLEEESLTTGYVLNDNDEGDFFSVDIKTDPVYKTPVFDLVAGTSSCPAEPGTQPRDDMQLQADQTIRTDVPADGQAEFTLRLGNTSQSGEARVYMLRLNQESNPDGAMVTIGGSPYTGPIPYAIGYLGELLVTVKVARGASTVYTYEGLEFELYAECDPEISKKVDLTVFFDSPCSTAAISEPGSNWILNQQANDLLALNLTGYDRNNLDQLFVQYTTSGLSSWSTAMVMNPEDLSDSPFGTTVDWDVTNLPDGRYDLRLKVTCGELANYSTRVTGLIDRTAPELLGIPEPADDHLVAGDLILATFDQELDCVQIADDAVSLVRLNDNQIFPATAGCFANEIEIIPVEELPSGTYRVSLQAVTDQHGNTADTGIEWEFAVGDGSIPSDGLGTGLLGTYYNNIDFTDEVFTRIDTTIDFYWQGGSPSVLMGGDLYSILWEGEVEAKYTETYTFYTATDDGVRLWVNDELLIDQWRDQGTTEWSGTIDLTAGERASIKIAYYEKYGYATARLLWSSASQSKQIVPKRYLFPKTTEQPDLSQPLPVAANSNLQMATKPLQPALRLFPNPALDVVHLTLQSNEALPTEVRFFDLSGREVALFMENIQQGENKLSFPVHDLPAGHYIVHLANAAFTASKPLIVLE